MKITAVVVVNAFGDVFNPENGEKIAGLLDANREKFLDMEEAFVKIMTTPKDLFHTNTTIGCISEEQILGKVYYCLWPLNSFGKIK